MSEHKKVMVAASGGIDSTTLAYMLAKEHGPENVILAYLNFGRALIDAECNSLVRFHATALSCLYITIRVHIPPVIAGSHPEFFSLQGMSAERHRRLQERWTDVTRTEEDFRRVYVPGMGTLGFTHLGMLAVSLGCQEVAVGLTAGDVGENTVESAIAFPLDFSTAFIDHLNDARETIWGLDAPRFITPLKNLLKEDVVAIARDCFDTDLYETHSCNLWPACGVCRECQERADALARAPF